MVDSTLFFKGTGYIGEQASTRTVPVMGTSLSQEKNAEAHYVNAAPFPEILESKLVQRSETSKLMSGYQPLLLLVLIVLYLLTASCTPHTENNEKPLFKICSSPKKSQTISFKMVT